MQGICQAKTGVREVAPAPAWDAHSLPFPGRVYRVSSRPMMSLGQRKSGERDASRPGREFWRTEHKRCRYIDTESKRRHLSSLTGIGMGNRSGPPAKTPLAFLV